MFVQISPSDNDVGETLSSLNFASRVRGVELGHAKKQIDTSELQKMKQMVSTIIEICWNSHFIFLSACLTDTLVIFFPLLLKLEKAKQEARLKDENIRKLEENCQNLENKLKGSHKSLQEKVRMDVYFIIFLYVKILSLM